MKKKLFLLILGLFLLTGCGNKVKCELVDKENNITTTIVGKFKGGKLSSYERKTSTKVDSSQEFEQVCKSAKLLSSVEDYKVECEKRTVTITQKLKSDSNTKYTKSEFMKMYKKLGYKCKK